ncbi:MAG: hypothetical protein K2Q26_00075 [Bdellovibrionales bacterium]|nr:hypothetical protein [Bdellovibrionales bacterium]
MKHIFVVIVGLNLLTSWVLASEAKVESIINPEMMKIDTWAEPVFAMAAEVPREVASQEKPEAVEIGPTQYLEVRKEIPASEPSLPRSWVEHRILNDRGE